MRLAAPRAVTSIATPSTQLGVRDARHRITTSWKVAASSSAADGYRRGMSEERPYIEENRRERERLKTFVDGLSDDELRSPVNPHWTVAAVFGHIAFWDGRVLALADKLERGEPFSASDAEPEDVDWINDASRPLIHAVPPREVARLALAIAEETDARVATLPLGRLWPTDPDSPLYAVRASHRGEHLDDVEAALRALRGRQGGTA